MFGEETIGIGGAATFGIAILVIVIYLMLNAQNATAHIVAFFVVSLPLMSSPYLPGQVFGIRGLSPVNFLTVLACLAVFMKIGLSGRLYGYLARFVSVPLAICMIVFVLSAAFTFFDADSLYYLGPADVQSYQPTRVEFLLYDCVRPLQIMVIGLLVMITCDLTGNKRLIQRALLLAPIALSIVGLVSSMVAGLTDYVAARAELGARTGLHGNDFGAVSLYFLVAAIIMRDHDWPRVRYLAIGFSMLGIVLSYSRMTFVATVCMLALLYFKLSAKERTIVASLAGVVILLFLGQLIERINYGLAESPAGLNINTVSAGRVGDIWVPALKQILEKPIFGYGIGMLVDSPTVGRFNPHNAYLVVLLYSGVVGLLAFGNLIFWAFKYALKYDDEIMYLLIVMLLLNLTGHGFYPAPRNYVLWVFFGLTLHTHFKERVAAKNDVQLSKPAGERFSHRSLTG